MLKKSLIIVLFLSLVFGQKRDPRSVALAGATTTIADGIYAVGYNPALIAFQIDKPFMMQIGGIDLGLGNNYLSIARLNWLSGDTLDNQEKSLILKGKHVYNIGCEKVETMKETFEYLINKTGSKSKIRQNKKNGDKHKKKNHK